MRIGLIGAGAVADFHITAARALDGLTITAVCDLDENAARRAANAASGARWFTDYRDLYESGAVDAVIVNTPHALHLPMVVDAARAGLHVLVEKPMATTLDDCDMMLSACADAGVLLTVGHIQHFMPDKLAVKQAIDSGDLGAVTLVRDYRSTDYRPGTRSGWFFSPEMAGGGALINIGGHCLDRSLWLADGTATEVFAATSHRFGSEVETDGNISLRLDNGIGVSISVISDPPLKADSLFVVCERGVIMADPRTGTHAQVNGESRTIYERRPDDIQRAFTAQLADFRAVIGGAQPTVPLSHARHVVELVLASYQSARRGGTVTLENSAIGATGAR